MLSFDEAIVLKTVAHNEGKERSFYKEVLTEEEFLRPELTGYLIDGLLTYRDIYYTTNKTLKLTDKGRDSLMEAVVYYRNKAEFLLKDTGMA